MKIIYYPLIICIVSTAHPGRADTHALPPSQSDTGTGQRFQDGTVVFDAVFFQRYQPNTALDLIRQVPGFQLDEGDGSRGFGGATGNIRINDRRPSAKQDSVSAILGRIPASNVRHIEIIREQVRGIDLGGYPVVANVVLLENAQAAFRWEIYSEKNLEPKPLAPGGSISMSNRWSEIDYNLGFDGRRVIYGDVGTDNLLDADNILTETRHDDTLTKGRELAANLNATTQFGETQLQVNIKLSDNNSDAELLSRRVSLLPGEPSRNEIFRDEAKSRQLEFGTDAERIVHDKLIGRAIFLYANQDGDEVASQRSIDNLGSQLLYRVADIRKQTTEAIGRVELDWAALANHLFQINMEAAFNSLDGSLLQREDSGAGLLNISVPGANTHVEELRGDMLVRDNWSQDNFEISYGVGMEVSRITQTGDTDLERTFFFIKPEGLLSYVPDTRQQTRLRLAREVSQLNFDDFLSATVFEDDDLALGNPDLQPETTWITELSYERRPGDYSMVKVTAFHHWISDVLDLLPLSSDFEAPGNIGKGRRWGLEIEGTVPLDRLGLASARLDIKARWQDSAVTDPVTGSRRVLSGKQVGPPGEYGYLRNESKYALTLDYRQDFEVSRVAWGWSLKSRAERPFFKVNELDIQNEGTEINSFIETTRWLGIKITFEVNRVFDVTEVRDRTFYTGARSLSEVDGYIQRVRDGGRELVLRLNGTF